MGNKSSCMASRDSRNLCSILNRWLANKIFKNTLKLEQNDWMMKKNLQFSRTNQLKKSASRRYRSSRINGKRKLQWWQLLKMVTKPLLSRIFSTSWVSQLCKKNYRMVNQRIIYFHPTQCNTPSLFIVVSFHSFCHLLMSHPVTANHQKGKQVPINIQPKVTEENSSDERRPYRKITSCSKAISFGRL